MKACFVGAGSIGKRHIKNLHQVCKKKNIMCEMHLFRSSNGELEREVLETEKAISSSYLPDWRSGTDYRNTYSAHKDQGGGVRIDLIHEWDYITFLFGMPQDVYCMDGRFSDLEIDCEDLAVYIAKYKDKIVELHLDYFGRKTRRSLEIRTNEHEYIFDIAEHGMIKDGENIVLPEEDANLKNIREMERFMNFAVQGGESGNDLKHAMSVLKIAKES